MTPTRRVMMYRGAGTGCYSVCAASDGCLTADGLGLTVRANDDTTWHFTPQQPQAVLSQLRDCPEIGPAKVVLEEGHGMATLDDILAAAPIRNSDMCVIL